MSSDTAIGRDRPAAARALRSRIAARIGIVVLMLGAAGAPLRIERLGSWPGLSTVAYDPSACGWRLATDEQRGDARLELRAGLLPAKTGAWPRGHSGGEISSLGPTSPHSFSSSHGG